MPFHSTKTWTYDKAAVQTINAGQNGVYGIYRPGRWVYIGSGDIRTRLLAHLNGDNPLITKENPTNWIADVTPNFIEREKQLTVELQPVANQKVG